MYIYNVLSIYMITPAGLRSHADQQWVDSQKVHSNLGDCCAIDILADCFANETNPTAVNQRHGRVRRKRCFIDGSRRVWGWQMTRVGRMDEWHRTRGECCWCWSGIISTHLRPATVSFLNRPDRRGVHQYNVPSFCLHCAIYLSIFCRYPGSNTREY